MDKTVYNNAGANVPNIRAIFFKFSVDAANAPALLNSNPLNLYVKSVVRVSQGLFRLTLHSFAYHVHTEAALNVAAAGQQRWTQPGPVANFGTTTDATVDILVVDNAGAVQDPAAAGAQNFISGCIYASDSGTV